MCAWADDVRDDNIAFVKLLGLLLLGLMLLGLLRYVECEWGSAVRA
jgi:hypothetical protein